MEVKNESWGTFLRDFPRILLKKIVAPFYITLFEPYLWKSYLDCFNQLPEALKKRKIIQKNKKVSAAVMSKKFKSKSSYL